MRDPAACLENIYNYRKISPLLATAGQPTEQQFGDIQQAGFAVVVNLALPTSDNALPHEKELVETLGMSYIAIPVLWENPTLQNFQDFQAVMEEWRDRPCFVHCAANMRVSVFVYLDRRLRGEPEAQVKGDLWAIWQPNPIWQAFMNQVLTAYQKL